MSQVFARRAGRIAFGVVLLAGVVSLAIPHETIAIGAARLVGRTWLIAVAVGLVVRAIAARLPWRPSPGLLFSESVVVPTAGIALLLPISLHLPVVLLFGDSGAFDFWVEASRWITGFAHLVFAGLCVLRAHQLVAGKPAIAPGKIYVATVVISCVPFVLLWAIPAALVAITALPFLPMLRAMQRLVDRERAELSTVAHALPRAVAVPPRGRR